MKKVSIVVPVYNEESTIQEILTRASKAITIGLDKEIIVVDDGSSDKTVSKIKNLKIKKLTLLKHMKNKGKGSALRTALKRASGDIILVQDADLEYSPKEYPKLLKPILKGAGKVVYGSRELSGKNTHSSIFFHAGGRLVTFLTNLLYGSSLTDESTGYKVFDAKFLKSLPLKCRRFEFCPEVTALTLKKGEKIIEVPISYSARHKEDGKKIKAMDGIEAIWTLLKIRFKNT